VSIDLNCDMGESFGAYKIGEDEKIIPYISSANIACGYHAGDPLVMDRTVQLAKEHGVAVGAHPGFPDLLGYGRRVLETQPGEVRRYVLYQVGALAAFCRVNKVELQHVKPHGAFYNMGAVDEKLARAIAESVARFDADIILVGLSGSAWVEACRKAGVRVASEIFADRAYNTDGTLVSRNLPGAVIHDADEVIGRAIRMAEKGTVIAINGKEIPVHGDTICLHGDTPGADVLAKKLNDGLKAAGIDVKPLGQLILK
jgi:UPF0271 protein